MSGNRNEGLGCSFGVAAGTAQPVQFAGSISSHQAKAFLCRQSRSTAGSQAFLRDTACLCLLWGLHSETIFSQGCKLKPCCSWIYRGDWGSPNEMELLVAGEGAGCGMCLSPPWLPPGVGQWGKLFSRPGWRTCLSSHHCGVRRWQSS